MKKNIEYLSFTALVLVGTLMTACSVKEEVLPEDPRPIPQDGLVMLSTTVGFEQSETRALTADGEKTFAAGDQIAVIYTNTSDNTVKAVSEVLTADKISAGGKSATFYVAVSNPKANSDVIYIYPASMAADNSGTPDLDALSIQDGKLETIAGNLDYARFEGTLTAKAELPASATLENQLAICEFTLLDSEDMDLSASITELRIEEGFYAYTVNWTPVAGPIYVAMWPVADNSITVTVRKSSVYYQKTFTNKTLAANKFYPITVMMPLQTEQAPALNLTSPTVGQVIGSDGMNYAANATLPTGVTKVAMIAYVSGSNGLAIALADEGSLNWETAKSTCEAKTPAFTNGTWKLPTKDEWRQMFEANGGNIDRYTGLNTTINTAGGTTLQENTIYWSSSVVNPGVDAYGVQLDTDGIARWYTVGENYGQQVRACLAFSSAPTAKAAAEATAEDKGKLIGTDGKIYDDVTAATAAGTTAVAKIIYIGTTGHATYNHGLALALTDEGQMSWGAAMTACNTTKNTSTPVTGATWLLASKDHWDYMLGTNGAGSYTALRDGFSGISGASNLQSDYYWSSTENEGDPNYAWGYFFFYGYWNPNAKSYPVVWVRACLAF